MKSVVTLSIMVAACGLAVTAPTAPAQGDKEVRDWTRGRKLGYADPLVLKKDHEVHGSRPQGLPCIPLDRLMRKSATWEGKAVQVRGTISGVCEKKGCWLRLSSGKDELFVRFKDYSFFVPFDVVGRPVLVEGVVKRRTLSEEERRHFAEDAGKSPEEVAKIKGEVSALQLTASAVRIGKLPPPPGKGEEEKGRQQADQPCPAGPDCPVCAEESRKKGAKKQDSRKDG